MSSFCIQALFNDLQGLKDNLLAVSPFLDKPHKFFGSKVKKQYFQIQKLKL